MSRPVLLGHRGLRLGTGPPENTFGAFEAALEAGCDGFEFDVRLSADAIPVICHDPDHAGRTVATSTAHDLSLPTLDAVLARYASRAFLDIELKVPGVEAKVARSVSNSAAAEQSFVVSSFLPQVLI